MADTLLLIEDESLLAGELTRHYAREGWEVVRAATLAEARRALFDEHLGPLVVVSDMSLPDGNALDLLERVRGEAIDGGEWLFLTAYGTVGDAVRGLRLGALDFLEKPCEVERLDLVVAAAARSSRAQRRLADRAARQSRSFPIEAWIGRSAAAAAVREMLARLSRVPWTALVLQGETGTGKGLAARILHANGARSAGPFIEVNCAALPRTLLESELFGYEHGAFTGARGRHRGLIEQAHGGTLFLDEIGEMDLELQAKLLTAVEERRLRRLGGEGEVRVDVQVTAASNRDLEAEVRAGRFRQDLYHRLTVFSLSLPPLRDHREDLEDLVPALVAEYGAKAGKRVSVVPDEVWQRLKAYRWPGNVRELRNVVERCVLLAEGEVFPLRWLQLAAEEEPAGGAAAEPAGRAVAEPAASDDRLCLPLDGSMSLEAMDRAIIARALERAGGNATAAARTLGTTRETLRYRIEKYGLKGGG
jgi:DNA-binding NtrC family response regulator